MSKYDAVRNVMGEQEVYNDSAKNGRILKWFSPTRGATLAQRKALAAEVLQKLIENEVWYVQKVEVRNATSTYWSMSGAITYEDDDKICVYIDKIPNAY